jgi:high-affinity Fe2+/Pb2+ permease
MGFFSTLLAVVFGVAGLLVGNMVGAARAVGAGNRKKILIPALVGLAIGVIIGLLIIPIIKITFQIFLFILVVLIVLVVASLVYYVFKRKQANKS